MTDYKNIIFSRHEFIGKVIFNRPGVLNAVDYDTIIEFKDILAKIAEDSDIRVLVITGSGEKSFIVGADQKEIKMQFHDEERAKSFEMQCRRGFSMLAGLGKPSICAINGYAFGLGLQLALACTFRIISFEAKMGLPEINMGFFPSMGATQRLTRIVGEAKAMDLILTGETIDADEAFRIGLASRIVPHEELDGFVGNFAEKLAEKSPLTMGLAMEAVSKGADMRIEDGLEHEARLSDICLKSDDAKEGIKARNEKRKPDFQGR
ncbi:MAG: enoyl-CoA hydratase/isomerase family protein [Deltaproteobacteria bacterium]|nr:enoyl-CoA hydratase/isomerase family protein [Deltaproteobacteria bacterium]